MAAISSISGCNECSRVDDTDLKEDCTTAVDRRSGLIAGALVLRTVLLVSNRRGARGIIIGDGLNAQQASGAVNSRATMLAVIFIMK